jgi:hypothetical protein
MPDIVSHQDFIGIYDNALSKEECEYVIDAFNNVEVNQNEKIEASQYRYNGELQRKDYVIYADVYLPEIQKLIGDRLHECLMLYCDHHFILKGIAAASREVKLQRTPPRGGYHIWHCEQDCLSNASRVLVWTIYLNDIPYNEGETEFLWQGVRVNPKAGCCAIWPAAFTHKHRGNPVYTHDKYIATGWYNLIE